MIKKILSIVILGLSMVMLAVASVPAVGGEEAYSAGMTALKAKQYGQAAEAFTRAVDSGDFSGKRLAEVYFHRGLANEGRKYLLDAEQDYGRAVWHDRRNETYLEKHRRMRGRVHGGP